MAAVVLAACAADDRADKAAETDTQDTAVRPIPTGTEAPMPELDPQFRQDFRVAYGAVLWRMMLLRWCDARWKRPAETAAAEARLAAINALAIRLGLQPEMDQAGTDNARQMAIMRLDVHCNLGFDPTHASAIEGLAALEKRMRDLPEASPRQGSV